MDQRGDEDSRYKIAMIYCRLRKRLKAALETPRPTFSLSAMQQDASRRDDEKEELKAYHAAMAGRVRDIAAAAKKDVSEIDPSKALDLEIPPEVDSRVIRLKVEEFLKEVEVVEEHL